jgi:hypothetical protein
LREEEFGPFVGAEEEAEETADVFCSELVWMLPLLGSEVIEEGRLRGGEWVGVAVPLSPVDIATIERSLMHGEIKGWVNKRGGVGQRQLGNERCLLLHHSLYEEDERMGEV